MRVGVRQGRHAAGVAVGAALKRAEALGIQPVAGELAQHRLRAVTGHLVEDGMRRQVFAGRHPDRRIVLFRQPLRQAEVIGVEVGDDDAGHGASSRARIWSQRARTLSRP